MQDGKKPLRYGRIDQERRSTHGVSQALPIASGECFANILPMPEYLTPGVYVEEVSFRSKPIEGVSTSTAAFIGLARKGPFAVARTPKLLTSFVEFERLHGNDQPLRGIIPSTNYLAKAVRAFFDEGGKQLYVARVKGDPSAPDNWVQAINAASSLEDISIVAAPGSTEFGLDAVQSALINDAEVRKRFAVLDIPRGQSPSQAQAYRSRFDSKSAAFYFPWVFTTEAPVKKGGSKIPVQPLFLPPSAFVCGIYARTDIERGVVKAPANEVIRSAAGFERDITRTEQDLLNPAGINCLRFFPGKGNLVWGARTAWSDPEWKYVNVRRYLSYLERSIDRGTQWAVFEPNGERLWQAIQKVISDFLFNEWRGGALLGVKPDQAYFVRCDRSTMTQGDIDSGRMICQVGVAMLKPSEFVVFRIGQRTADAK